MKTLTKILASMFLPAIFCINLHAGTYRTYDVSNGLSGNSVFDIVQDSLGRMWFATKDGINRFDSQTFTKYVPSPEGNPLPVEHLVLHPDGRHIIVSSAAGIYFFDTFNEKFEKSEYVSSSSVAAFDKYGTLWIGAKGRIVRYDEQDPGKSKTYEFPVMQDGNRCMVRDIACDKYGRLWVATQGGLFKYIENKDDFVIVNPIRTNNPTDSYFTTISAGEEFLIGSQTGQILTLNDERSGLELILSDPALGRIIDIFEISPKEYLISTDNGLFKMNSPIGKITKDPNIDGDSVNKCFKDHEGGIWIATYFGGIKYLSPKSGEFEWHHFHGDNCHGTCGNAVSQFCEDSNGNMWIATENGGLKYFDIMTGKFTDYSHKSHYNIHALCMYSDYLWIGTFSDGIHRMNLKTGNIVKFLHRDGDSESIPSNFVYAIIKHSDGYLYIGLNGGLCIWENGKFKPVEGFGKYFVFDLEEGPDGSLWVGTKSDGIFRLLPNGKWKRYLNFSRRINRVYVDSKDKVWICSEDSGIAMYDEINDSFISFSARENLPAGIYYGILDDEQGYLWLSSNHGLIKYSPDDFKYQTYTEEDGLQSSQFNYRSSFKHSSGKLYFGGVNGFNSFFSTKLTANTVKPTARISSVEIVPQYNYDGRPEIVKNSDGEVTIPHMTSSFIINFETMSYVAPRQNRYAWKIDRLQDEWTYTAESSVNIMKLPAGEYTMRMKGCNNNGIWSEKEDILRIRVIPSPWLSPFAKTIYAILCISFITGGATLFYRKRVRALKQEQKQAIISSKIDFFTQIAHEIKTPLTLIEAPLESIIETIKPTSEEKENLEIIRKNVSRMHDLIFQLLDFRKIDKEGYRLTYSNFDILLLIEDIVNRFRKYDTGIRVSTKATFSPAICYADEEAMTKIISNLLQNAFKYAKSEIVMELERNGSNMVLSVSDDGPGIPDEIGDKIFEPFFQAKDGGAGFGIGLSLVKLLVDKHNGNIRIDRKYEQGCRIIVEIPVKRENAEIIEKFDFHKDVHILIVDDTAEMLSFLVSELGKNYNTVGATSGQEALKILDEQQFHLIISDIMMPDMDGFEFLKKVRENELTSHIPFVLLSAFCSTDHKITGLEYGADAIVEKPFSIHHLRATLDNLIENRKKLYETFNNSPFPRKVGDFNTVDSKWLDKIDLHIKENLDKEDFSIDTLAEMMNMSRSNLHKKIKGITGTTPNEYIKLYKLKTAASLLRNEDLRVNEVCEMVGMSNHSYFSKLFKEHFGVSPNEYIRKG